MLILGSSDLAISRELEEARRKMNRFRNGVGAILGAGVLTAAIGLGGFLFNFVLPVYGFLAGIDTWGNISAIPAFVVTMLIGLAGAFCGTLAIGPHWDRAEAAYKEIQAEISRDERIEEGEARRAAKAVRMSFECGSPRHRDFSEYPYEHCRHC